MENKDYQYYELLKQEIVQTMKQSYPGINDSIAQWKGQDIVDFQEELLRKVNENISEKWFYIHMKSEESNLPRIDVLNFLCRYVGYENWADFKHRQTEDITKTDSGNKSNRVFFMIPLLVAVILIILLLLFKLFDTREYSFCFYDGDTKEPIKNELIEVSLLLEKESPMHYLCDPNGCFNLKTDRRKIEFVVKSPYYKTDTFTRVLDRFNRNESIKLNTNDYALMIHYFSTNSVSEWQKRRRQLDEMIADSALIFQLFDQEHIGMELYNKWEFIDKLTLPVTSLKAIEIIDTRYNGEQISYLRFKQMSLD